MAGIGFELKKLYGKQGLFSLLRAVGYSSAVCVGPMLLGIVLLLGILLQCSYYGRSVHDRELLVCMTTYSLLLSLMVTSVFSMVNTRFLADQLYSGHREAVLPSFFGINAIILPAGGLLFGVFLLCSGTDLPRSFFVLCFFLELIVCWNAQSYLTAVKEYRGIFVSYLLAIVFSLLPSGLLLKQGKDTVTSTLAGLCIGYGTMMLYDFVLIFRRFPDSADSPFAFFGWARRYKSLIGIGIFMTLGLFGHLLIIWFSPLQVVVEGFWVGAPYYDVPALLAFLTTLVTTVSFVVSVEVNFYPRYRDYFALFNDRGTIRDIHRVEQEMLNTLQRELWFTALKQLFVSAACISLGELILGLLPLGFNDLMFGYFRTLTVGYGIYAVANTFLLILLYFTDYTGALWASAVFALFSCAGTLLFLRFDTVFYGFGFLLGAVLFFLVAVLRLNAYTRKLPYHALAAQPLQNTAEMTEGSDLYEV